MELLLNIAEEILNIQENLNKIFLEEFFLIELRKLWELEIFFISNLFQT